MNIKNYLLIYVFFFFSLLNMAKPFPVLAKTYNVTCSGDIYSIVQGYLDSMVDGDVLSIGPGSCTTSATFYWDNKDITVRGAGSGSTTITASYGTAIFSIKSTTGTSATTSTGMSVLKRAWTLKGMTLTGSNSGWGAVSINDRDYGGSTPIVGWRITDINFVDKNTPSPRDIWIWGLNWGLIDSCTFTATGGKIAITPYSAIDYEFDNAAAAGVYPHQSWEGNAAWALPLHLGSEEALYIEDCTFDGSTGNDDGMAATDLTAGGAVVFRHNTLKAADFYAHTGEGGTLGRGGSRKFEIYNNTFIGYSFFEPIGFQENGTGVIYNNTISGYAFNGTLFGLYRAAGYMGTSFDYIGYYYGNCWGTGINCGVRGNESCQNWGGGATASHDGNIESTGWPCLDQLGRGSGVPLGAAQPSVPVYIWNNGPQAKCSDPKAAGPACDGSASKIALNLAMTFQWLLSNYYKGYSEVDSVDTKHTNNDRDYCAYATTAPISGVTTCGNHTFSYTAFTYPHPLRALTDTTPPAAPTGLSIY